MNFLDTSDAYRKLDSFTLASIIELGTHHFCGRFLDLTNDASIFTYDRMNQAARSVRTGIIKGSVLAATSPEAELEYTVQAQRSMWDLHGEYEEWLMMKQQVPWAAQSDEARAVRAVRLDPVSEREASNAHNSGKYLLRQKARFDQWIENDDDLVAANALLILCQRATRVLERQIEAQEDRLLEAEEKGFFLNYAAPLVD